MFGNVPGIVQASESRATLSDAPDLVGRGSSEPLLGREGKNQPACNSNNFVLECYPVELPQRNRPSRRVLESHGVPTLVFLTVCTKNRRRYESAESKWNYIQNNPVRAGLVSVAELWPYQGKIFRPGFWY